MLSAAKEMTPEPQWSTTQRKLLDLLQDEENRQISRLDLCHKAGFAFAGPWYASNKHPEFRAAVKALYAEGERHRPNAKAQMRLNGIQWTKTQQTLLDLLQDEENRQLKLSELCRKAGFANHGYWYRAIEDPQFREALKDLGVEIKRCKPDLADQASIQGAKWGNAHQQLLDVLQDEENRHLSVVELCQKAGFAAKKAWYRAIKHPLFREKVEALGVEIERTGINAKLRETKAQPQWGYIHQTLLDLLQIEENRHLSVVELCQKTSFGQSCWYRAIKHPLFREKVEALGVKIERHELSAKGQTRAQRKILQVLQEEANRELPIVEICRRAGYSDDFWYKALKSEAFVKELEVLGVPVIRRKHNENGWTEVQQNLLEVLQEPANRQLSPTELCQKAGYPKCSYWFRALRNPRFVVAVEALGIEIWRNRRNADSFTRAQQRFLDFLQEDPIITAGELCRKAGYTSTSSWTEVIQDSHFVASLESRGFQVERLKRRQDGWTWGQKRLLAILQNEAHRDLPIVEICRMAGYSTRVWYEALRRASVLAAIKDLQVRIRRCGPDEDGWTWAQQRLLHVLQDEAKRQLSIIELCTEAGYSDLSRWYESLDSEQFVETLQAWGVQIARHKPPSLPHTDVRPSMSLEEDLRQDVWDMRRFKPDYPKHRDPSAYLVDFTWIENPQLREQVKRYLRQRLPKWEAATFALHIRKLKGVLAHLPADVAVETITRAHIEAILPAILAQSSDYWAMCSLGATRAMFVYMAESRNWDGSRPSQDLINREDIPSSKNALPRPIPPDVLDQLDPLLALAIQNIKEGCEPPILEPIFWDAILILRRTGMRFADLAHLEAPSDHNRGGCLGQDADGSWWIHIRPDMTKMGREHQIPTSPEDGSVEAILRQAERVQTIPDHFGQNYLFCTEQGVLTYRAFYKALEKLGRYFNYVGQPYAITPHQFRHTIATDMISNDVDLVIVKEFLGHKSLNMTLKYVKVYKEGLQAKYQDYRARASLYSAFVPLPMQVFSPEMSFTNPGAIMPGWVEGYEGRLYRFELPSGIGVCEQTPGLQLPCLTGSQCSTTCTKLRSGKQHLSAWESRISGLQATIETLKDYPGYEWHCQQHQQELKQIEKIITTIQTEGFWDGRMHNAESYESRPVSPECSKQV